MNTETVSFPSARTGITTTATIERTSHTLTVIIDGQAVVSKFKGRGFVCLEDNPGMLADAFFALTQK